MLVQVLNSSLSNQTFPTSTTKQYQVFFFLLILNHPTLPYTYSSAEDLDSISHLQTYIFYLKPHPGQLDNEDTWYHSFLPAADPNNVPDTKSRRVHTYHSVVNGFAAKLSAQEAEEMAKLNGFLFSRPERLLPLHTTHCPNFLGLHQNLGFWGASDYGKGFIIRVLDTGITPNHPSSNDQGVPPPPAKWKGKCKLTEEGACNNKLIGARSFISRTSGSPTDDHEHGTHTASTAADDFVRGDNFFGYANGTAAGIAPLAHVAMYKVSNEEGYCGDSDVLAGLDSAIEDGHVYPSKASKPGLVYEMITYLNCVL